MKITPSHDQNDYECGKRHGLEFINIFNDDGTVNENGGKFKGMHRWAVREAITIELKNMKLLKEIKVFLIVFVIGVLVYLFVTGSQNVFGSLFSQQGRVGASNQASVVCGLPRHGCKSRRCGEERRTGNFSQNVRGELVSLDGKHHRLVHQSSALVGSSSAGLFGSSQRLKKKKTEKFFFF